MEIDVDMLVKELKEAASMPLEEEEEIIEYVKFAARSRKKHCGLRSVEDESDSTQPLPPPPSAVSPQPSPPSAISPLPISPPDVLPSLPPPSAVSPPPPPPSTISPLSPPSSTVSPMYPPPPLQAVQAQSQPMAAKSFKNSLGSIASKMEVEEKPVEPSRSAARASRPMAKMIRATFIIIL